MGLHNRNINWRFIEVKQNLCPDQVVKWAIVQCHCAWKLDIRR